MKFNYLLQILTFCQGIWVIILLSFLMWHYVIKSVKNRFLEKRAIYMGISYMCLTTGTMITSLKGIYNWFDAWQIIVIIGYIFGDIIIVKMLFHITRNDATKRRIEEYIKNQKENQKHE